VFAADEPYDDRYPPDRRGSDDRYPPDRYDRHRGRPASPPRFPVCYCAKFKR